MVGDSVDRGYRQEDFQKAWQRSFGAILVGLFGFGASVYLPTIMSPAVKDVWVLQFLFLIIGIGGAVLGPLSVIKDRMRIIETRDKFKREFKCEWVPGWYEESVSAVTCEKIKQVIQTAILVKLSNQAILCQSYFREKDELVDGRKISQTSVSEVARIDRNAEEARKEFYRLRDLAGRFTNLGRWTDLKGAMEGAHEFLEGVERRPQVV